nr:hypothetical protein [Tanacetum cinerariifolium]
MLPIELTNVDIRNSEAYKEYYAISTGATPPKTKASVWRTKSSSDTTVIPPPTAVASSRLSTFAKGKQPTKASKAKNEGTGTIPGVLDVPNDESDEEISWKSSDEGDDDDKEGSDDQDDDDDAQDDDDDEDDVNKDDDDQEEGDDDDDQEEGNDDDQDSNKEGEEFIHPRLSIHDKEETRDEESFNPIPKTPENTNDEGNSKENIGLNVGREEGQDEEDDEDELYRDVNINLEGKGVQMANVHTAQESKDSHVTLTSLAGAVSSISEIIQRYMDQWMNEAVKTVNEQLEAEVLTRSSNSSETSYVVAADLSEMDLKKILIEKIEGNKRRDDDAKKDKEPFAGSDRGSKRRREGKEPVSTSAPEEKATRSAGKSTQGSKSRQMSASESATAKEPMQTTYEMEELSHPEFEIGVDDQPIAEPSQESARDVYSKRRIIAVTELKIVEWHNYKHLDWITNVYKKHRNLKACGRPSNRCRKLPEEAQSHKAGYNKDKQNRLMRIDELHRFSDGTLTDVRTALDDRLKGIRMKYLPQTIWRKSDKERATTMIHVIDKQLKTRRIMRSLERFVDGRLYEGDFRMLQWTI